jgi:AcrR family transcriptional regulator
MTRQSPTGASRRRGRPTAYTREQALDAAMRLFWERGYEGTSFAELVAAMRIGHATFYGAFGSKEELYRVATERYVTEYAGFFLKALKSGKDTRSSFQSLMEASAHAYTREGLPRGCMVSLVGTHVPPVLTSVRDIMRDVRRYGEELLSARLREGVAQGDLSPDTEVEELAAFFEAALRGMAVKARDGVSVDRLLMIGRAAMRAWPTAEVDEVRK